MQGSKSRITFLVMAVDYIFVLAAKLQIIASTMLFRSVKDTDLTCVCAYDVAFYVFSKLIEANIELQVIFGVKDKASTIDKIVIK